MGPKEKYGIKVEGDEEAVSVEIQDKELKIAVLSLDPTGTAGTDFYYLADSFTGEPALSPEDASKFRDEVEAVYSDPENIDEIIKLAKEHGDLLTELKEIQRRAMELLLHTKKEELIKGSK